MKNKVTIKTLIFIIFVSICFISFSVFGFIKYSEIKNNVVEKNLDGGKVSLNYLSDFSFLNKSNQSPLIDSLGIISSDVDGYFDFDVDTEFDNANNISYELSLSKVSGTIPDGDIKVYLEKEDSGTYSAVFEPKLFKKINKDSDLGSKKGSMILVKSSLKKSTVDHYRLRTWVSDKSMLSTGNYVLEINLVAKAK